AKFPVPRLLVHGSDKTMRWRILFQPFIRWIAIPASHSYIECSTVLMVGSAWRRGEIVARQTSLIAVIQCLLLCIRPKSAVDRDLHRIAGRCFDQRQVGLNRAQVDSFNLKLHIDNFDERSLPKIAPAFPCGVRTIFPGTRFRRNFAERLIDELTTEISNRGPAIFLAPIRGHGMGKYD